MGISQLLLSILSLLLLVALGVLYHWYSKFKNQEKQLKELNNTHNRLYTILEQEVRKPILSFRGISKKIDFLINHKELETVKKLGNQLDNDAHELGLLLENLLRWSKTFKGTQPYNPQPIPVKLIIDNINDIYTSIAQEKSVKLSTDFEEAAHISADLDALLLVLKNIISQIIKQSTNQESLKINISAPSKLVKISISSQAITPTFIEAAENGQIKNGFFDYSVLKELVEYNRGSIQYLPATNNQHPSIQCSFPRA